MNTEERREKLLARLQRSDQPVTGTKLSREFSVSRQIIVGDISILRAQGAQIFATPRGYVLPSGHKESMLGTLVCRHDAAAVEAELMAIIDNGGAVLDVIVEHPVYGPIRGDLLLESRRDIRNFLSKMKKCQANPLLIITGGTHLHTVRVPDEETLQIIRRELDELGILTEE